MFHLLLLLLLCSMAYMGEATFVSMVGVVGTLALDLLVLPFCVPLLVESVLYHLLLRR